MINSNTPSPLIIDKTYCHPDCYYFQANPDPYQSAFCQKVEDYIEYYDGHLAICTLKKYKNKNGKTI